jgi:hypothetical protein
LKTTRTHSLTSRSRASLLAATGAIALLAASSCSTLVGSVKPVDRKSERYGILDLSREAPQAWKKLETAQLLPEDAQITSNASAFSSEISDMAFQSQRTSAIISLNSSCRKGRGAASDLQPYLRELFLGMTDREDQAEPRETTLSGVPALSQTVEGRMAGELTKIEAVVLSKADCVYDLMYISRPEAFAVHEKDFKRFVSSLRLR